MTKKINRRDFIKTSTLTAAGFTVAPFSMMKQKGSRRAGDKVRIGVIGVGNRGSSHVAGFAERDDVEIPAVCDVRKDRAQEASKMITDAGLNAPELYTRGETDFRRLVQRDDLDGVIIATPWLWHVPMAVAAMKAGKFTGVEVPAATTVDGCWDLVNTSEETGEHCMILENACYRRDVVTILNMVRQGLFGEMVHARCGYQHNVPNLFDEQGNFGPGSDGNGTKSTWRTLHYLHRDGDLYPTHGVGPVSHWLDINRGNRYLTITSHSTKSRGMHDQIVKLAGKDSPNASVKFNEGDVVTSTLTTANDETVIVTHNTTLPRPYSLGFRCQGTKGIWMVDNNSIYLDGVSPEHDTWESFDQYKDKYDSALWQKYEQQATGEGHGGMDFFIRNAFVESIKRNAYPPIDVYDAAAWSVLSPLSAESIEKGGQPVEIPDFTGGRWMNNERIFKPEKMDY